jgi:nicotinamidase-related amidase
MDSVLPIVAELAGRYPERTVFTRFIPPKSSSDMPGMWQRYYAKWKQATRQQLDPALLRLLPPLTELSPPATVIDKTRYSAFAGSTLLAHLRARQADGLIVDAVDLGYRVIVVQDAICSSSDEGHDALMRIYHQRYSEQIEVADAATIMERWER